MHIINTECYFCKEPFNLEVELKKPPFVFKYKHRCHICLFTNETIATFEEPLVTTEVIIKSKKDKDIHRRWMDSDIDDFFKWRASELTKKAKKK